MTAPKPRSVFGTAKIDRLMTELVSEVGADSNDDLIRSMLVTALDMDEANVDRRELKIASQALAEILHSWKVFAPYNERAKVTVFGSARTKPDAPDYKLAADFSSVMSDRGWMTITGAGPGIMTAGIEGAQLENAIGVGIVLPFEEKAAEIIEGDPKLAIFKYFFTRKLAFMKETDAFALFPGGFGTMDEGFELLTLMQTGKCYPAPVVLLDHPESNYWNGWETFVRDGLLKDGMISPDDLDLYFHTHDPQEAADYVCGFYSTYHSLRFVSGRLILRLRHALDDAAIAALNDEFSSLLASGTIEPVTATKVELRDNDLADLPRLRLDFNNRAWANLIKMIHRINELGSTDEAPASGLVHGVDPAMYMESFDKPVDEDL